MILVVLEGDASWWMPFEGSVPAPARRIGMSSMECVCPQRPPWPQDDAMVQKRSIPFFNRIQFLQEDANLADAELRELIDLGLLSGFVRSS